MTRLTQIILIAIVFFAVALPPQASEAATLTVEIRLSEGGGAGPTPVLGTDVSIKNLETGKSAAETINNHGIAGTARFRGMREGHYLILFTITTRKGETRDYETYRFFGNNDNIRIKVSTDDFSPWDNPGSRLLEKIEAAKKGNRSEIDATLKYALTTTKYHEQALISLNRIIPALRNRVIARLPKSIGTRLQKELDAAPASEHRSIIQKYIDLAVKTAFSIRRNVTVAKRNKLYKTAKRLQKKESRWDKTRQTLILLINIYYNTAHHRTSIKKSRQLYEKINRALDAPKPASPSKPTTTSQAPGGGYGDSEGASCFTAGTRVLMAGGGTKSIEEVRIGDRVRGKDGAVNKVTGIERPKLGKRLLYSINGGRAFVTAEHPFWTAGGWKSIDPRATFAENPRLVVGALAVGDRIAMVASRAQQRLASTGSGAMAVRYAPTMSQPTIAIRSILGVTGDPKMRVYNLLLDGNHSYFADSFLVHNKG